MNLFHRHKFDPEKWKQISKVPVSSQSTLHGVGIGEVRNLGYETVFSNTCTTCGDLVFRRVTEVE